MSGPAGKPEGQAHCTPATELCAEREAAQRLGLSVATLRRRRLRRQPPVWVKIGSRVLYRKRDLESFVEANVVCLPDSSAGDTQPGGRK
jgi:predicted DNA-binding transcriptional regulator AlpA